MYNILLYIVFILGILPLAFQVIKTKKLWSNNTITPFVWLTALATCYEFFGTFLLRLDSKYWFQLYPLLSFLALYFFFFTSLSSRYFKIMKISFILFFVVYSISFFYIEPNKLVASSINRLYISIFIFTFSVIWFKEVFEKLNKSLPFDEIDIQYLWNSEDFYFVAGAFMYYATTFFLFLSSHLIFSSGLYAYDFWIINLIATLLLRLFLIISLWKMKKV